MADRTDIDALLVSSLYGELTPADEARLAAHLESHPADRTALADLGQTRARVRDHQPLVAQLEPPQSISARLLQEAARVAPKVSQRGRDDAGWFLRLARPLLAHPAMASAAMFALVVGVAGALYVRHGQQFAAPAGTIMITSGSQQPSAAVGPAVAPSSETSNMRARGAVAADRASGAVESAPAVHDRPADPTPGEPPPRAAAPAPMAPVAPPAPAPSAAPKQFAKSSKGGVSGIEVSGSREPTVKDLDEEDSAKNYVELRRKEAPSKRTVAKPASREQEISPRAKAASGGNGEAMEQDSAPLGGAAAAAPAPPQSAPAAAKPDARGADKATLVWAQQQHASVIALVKSSQCPAAASAATEIYARAPEYYLANVTTDRAVKPCQPYLVKARAVEDRKRRADQSQMMDSQK
jgi:anti-sigma factor RsiW